MILDLEDSESIKESNYEEYYKMGLATIHEKNTFENYDEFEINSKKLDETLDHWLGNNDGQSGQRVRKFVKQIL